MSNIEKRVAEAAARAQEAFWATIAASFPEITSGDFSPGDQVAFDAACVKAAEVWVAGNSRLPVPALSDQRFNYQLLARLQQDCEYYLGAGGRHKKHLWALDEQEQIQKMKELYAGLPEKPEWITLADIERYEAAMVGMAQDKTFVIELKKTIVVSVVAENESAAFETATGSDYCDDGAWDRAEPEATLLETR